MQTSTRSEKSVWTCSKIDQALRPSLIRRIVAVLKETKAHKASYFDEVFWNWQFGQIPLKECSVVGLLQDGDVKGYVHAPFFWGKVNGTLKRFANAQDGAMAAELRRHGAFKTLMEFADQDMKDMGANLIYGFPNHKSIHTFKKYVHWRHLFTLRTYILPVNIGGVLSTAWNFLFRSRGDDGVELHQNLNEDIASVFADFLGDDSVSLVRDRAYLQWRFVERPYSRHFVFSLQEEGRAQAAAIFKLDTMFGHPVLLLMDFACRKGKEGSLLKLIAAVKENRDKKIPERFDLILAIGYGRFFPELWRLGFIRLPEKLVPRPIPFLVKDLQGDIQDQILIPERWHVTLSDWDVF